MNTKSPQSKKLLSDYKKIVRDSPTLPDEGADLSLEQPYFGRVVQTVTTYSVYEAPIADIANLPEKNLVG